MRETLLGLLGRQIDSLLARRMFAEASQLQSKYVHYRRLELARDSDAPREYVMLRLSLYKYAMCLEELGHEEEARQAYQECLEVAKQALAHPIRTGAIQEEGIVVYSVICPFPELRDDPAMYERARELLQEAESKYPGYRCTAGPDQSGLGRVSGRTLGRGTGGFCEGQRE